MIAVKKENNRALTSFNGLRCALSIIGICVAAISCIFSSGCSNNSASLNTANYVAGTGVAQNTNAAVFDYYTVRQNEGLSDIANRFDIKKAILIQSNRLKDPYDLHVGQRLRIPVPASAIKTGNAAELPLPRHSLLWPAKGKIVRTFAAGAAGVHNASKGIDIVGALGQDVVASGSGKVVYSGEALKGYGKTIIIKHRDNAVTVYAFARRALVHEGQTVKAGEKIAKMGSDASGAVMLHFEVRINGMPQDPLLYLQQTQQTS